MSVYRRLARSKKGMSTIFGGLFFVIIILMGFNLLLWGFTQYDAYNSVISSMSQRDQQAASENLVPVNPGLLDFTPNSFNISVTNLGIAVSLARIYITNVFPGLRAACTSGPCIVDLLPGTPYLSNANVPEGAGAINPHKIKVTGLVIDNTDGSGYKIVLASTRGRLFSFFYPWPVPPPPTSSLFQTNIGPLTVYFDFRSFNFTFGGQTQSQGAWVMPVNTNEVIWLKVANAASDGPIMLRVVSSLRFVSYSSAGGGASTSFYIVDQNTLNPNNIIAYNENTNPYVLPAASPNGPTTFSIVKFGTVAPNPLSSTVGSTTQVKFPNSEDTFVVFIGFYYTYRGNFQGQTVPFVAVRTCTAYFTNNSSCF